MFRDTRYLFQALCFHIQVDKQSCSYHYGHKDSCTLCEFRKLTCTRRVRSLGEGLGIGTYLPNICMGISVNQDPELRLQRLVIQTETWLIPTPLQPATSYYHRDETRSLLLRTLHSKHISLCFKIRLSQFPILMHQASIISYMFPRRTFIMSLIFS